MLEQAEGATCPQIVATTAPLVVVALTTVAVVSRAFGRLQQQLAPEADAVTLLYQ